MCGACVPSVDLKRCRIARRSCLFFSCTDLIEGESAEMSSGGQEASWPPPVRRTLHLMSLCYAVSESERRSESSG